MIYVNHGTRVHILNLNHHTKFPYVTGLVTICGQQFDGGAAEDTSLLLCARCEKQDRQWPQLAWPISRAEVVCVSDFGPYLNYNDYVDEVIRKKYAFAAL